MEHRDRLVKDFFSGHTSSYAFVNKKKVEEYFSELVDKICSKQELDDIDKSFLDKYVSDYYEYLGGDFRRITNYDTKLTPAHKKYAEHLMKNEEVINEINIIFLIYYFSSIMCKEFGMKPYVKLETNEYFQANPGTRAFHSNDKGNGAPIVSFNPNYIKECIKDKTILSLLNTVFHELEHENQTMAMKSKSISNAQALIWGKECLLRNIIGERYYKANYLDVFLERDARDYAYNKVLQVKEEYCDPKKEYTLYADKAERAKYDTSIKHEDVRTGDKVIAIDLLDAVATEYIKKNPQLLNGYLVLNVIYNPDGTKKNIVQIETELEEQKQQEFQKNPEDEKKINAKYSLLVHNIAKTDNDLLIQYLCIQADECVKENDETGLKTKMARISQIMKSRQSSYEEVKMNINRRIHELEKVSYKSPWYRSVRKELTETRKLVRCLIKYNEFFKQQHDEKELEDKYNVELQRIIHMNLSDKKFIVGDRSGDGSVIVENKTQKELQKEYEEAKKRLNESDVELEDYEEYMKFLDSQYIKFKDSIDDNDKKNEGNKKH